MGWPTGLFIDGATTVADAQSGAMHVKNSILSGMGTNFQSTDATFQAGMNTWFTTNGGRIFTDNSEVLLADAFNLNNPNAMPTKGSPLSVGGATPPNDAFFDVTATHVGAFGKIDWTAGWSTFNFQVPTLVGTETTEGIPSDLNLYANYPNPFNPTTTIQFGLPREAKVKLTVYNLLGEEVATLVNGVQKAGSHQIQWNAKNLPSGIYIYNLDAGSIVLHKKLMLLK
jgi:hypothetical protein